MHKKIGYNLIFFIVLVCVYKFTIYNLQFTSNQANFVQTHRAAATYRSSVYNVNYTMHIIE